jgi:hypothetical protein
VLISEIRSDKSKEDIKHRRKCLQNPNMNVLERKNINSSRSPEYPPLVNATNHKASPNKQADMNSSVKLQSQTHKPPNYITKLLNLPPPLPASIFSFSAGLFRNPS